MVGFSRVALGNGIYGNGVGAESMAMAGAEVAWSKDPLTAMTANPAGLGFLNKPEAVLGAEGDALSGTFSKTGSGGPLTDRLIAAPEGAIGYPLKGIPLKLGLSVAPESGLVADWHYQDPPGGLGGIQYGNQEDKSSIILIRTAFGAAWTVTPKLSIGASIGLLYNENDMVTPYVFQNLQPASVNGAKTLLNLHTTGFGGDGTVGMIYKATPALQFGAFYQSPSVINSSGDATGDPYAQFPPTPPGPLAFHYNAEVKNQFPQNASLGLSWQCLSRLRLAVQLDWIDWADSFNTLHASFSSGDNPSVNKVLGSSFRDNIPLNWSSSLVYRAGIEFAVTDHFKLMMGYAYGKSPVPDSTLSPMTAAISENTLCAGMGYSRGAYFVELAYQYDLPASQTVGQSGLLSGEYSNSSVQISAQALALSLGMTF